MRCQSLLVLSLVGLAACASPQAGGTEADTSKIAAPAAEERESDAALRGLDFAQAHCSGCHAIKALQVSPNPESPPFDSVVNTPGLTPQTLNTFLRDSHNFPEVMNFDIDSGQIDDLTAYMLTLRQQSVPVPAQSLPF